MRQKVSFYLKNSNFFSELYFVLGTILVNFLKIFVKTNKKSMLFVSYGGKQMSDSPLAVYNKVKNDPRFHDWKLTWAFIEPDKFKQVPNRVKIDSIEYFYNCLSVRVWITNSGIKRYLNFQGKNTFFVNTWHGIPLKKIGSDEKGVKKSKIFARKWHEFSTADINLYHSDYDFKILQHVFNAPESSFFEFGLPRNDMLFDYANDTLYRENIKKKLNIPSDKKVVLYAPTVRGEKVTKSKGNVFDSPIDFERWAKELPNYVILFRAHYFVTKTNDMNFNNVIDVTNYPNIDDLYLASDSLISDYSSVFFDYSILKRPMFCFAYDLEDYEKYQGLYEMPKSIIAHFSTTEEELIDQIRNYGQLEVDNSTVAFKEKFLGHTGGRAAEKVVDEIYSNII